MTRRHVAAAGLIATTVVLAALAKIFVFVDIEKLGDRMLVRIADEQRAGTFDDSALRAMHAGPGPCFSYLHDDELTAAEISATLDDAARVHLLDRLIGSSRVLWRWGYLDERTRHGGPSDAELLWAIDQYGTFRERIPARLTSRWLAGRLRTVAEERSRAALAVAEEQERRLTDDERGALRALWQRHPTALSFVGFLRVTPELRRRLGKTAAAH